MWLISLWCLFYFTLSKLTICASIVQHYVSVLSFVSMWVLNCLKKYLVCSSVSILSFKGSIIRILENAVGLTKTPVFLCGRGIWGKFVSFQNRWNCYYWGVVALVVTFILNIVPFYIPRNVLLFFLQKITVLESIPINSCALGVIPPVVQIN